MKFKLLILSALLSTQAYSQDFEGFGTDIKDFKTYFEDQAYDDSRTYEFECVNTYTYTNYEGILSRTTSMTSGRQTLNTSNNGLNTSYSTEFSYFNGRGEVTGFNIGIITREFTDNDTMVITSESRGINEREVTPVFRERKRVATQKLVNGKIVATETTASSDRTAETITSLTISYDPFKTRFATTNEYEFTDVDEDGTELKSYQRSMCQYKQVGVNNYMELYPKMLVGNWTQSPLDSEETKQVSFTKDGFDAKAYTVNGKILDFAGRKFRLDFSSPNTVRLINLGDGSEYILKRNKENI